MKKISEIISKELFLNAFEICQEYCKSEEFILDVNFRLLKNTFLMLSPKIVSNYYDEMIKNDFVYSLPELFSSDIVLIPKKLTSVREYRFFSVYSMILYNAVGLLFVDSCSEMLNNVNFNRNKINAFYPTKFKRKDSKWIVSNDYKTEYKKFTESLKKSILPNDIILQIDISNYFENISHNILISLLTDFAPESLLNKHNYNVDSDSILEFYFNSLMQRSYSIPQGRKNFVSDYFGYFYLIPFEMEIHNITKHDSLKFKKIIRYVDDIYIIFNTDIVDSSIIFKELLKIEHCISEWLLNKLKLSINPDKIKRDIIKTTDEKIEYVKNNTKTISSPIAKTPAIFNEACDELTELDANKVAFIESLKKFNFENLQNLNFNFGAKDRENLKLIFNKKFSNYLFKSDVINEISEVLKNIDFDLTPDYINIIISLFILKKSEENPYLSLLKDALKNKIVVCDKRHIHIILSALAQKGMKLPIKNTVKKSKSKLIEDNYGKYLLLICDLTFKKTNYDLVSNQAIYERITYEFKQKKKKRKFFYKNDTTYSILLKWVHNQPEKSTEGIIRQLKYFVHYKMNKKWDIAFNNFHSLFHEICKNIGHLQDQDSINKVVNLLKLPVKDELIIRKFTIEEISTSYLIQVRKVYQPLKLTKQILIIILNLL